MKKSRSKGKAEPKGSDIWSKLASQRAAQKLEELAAADGAEEVKKEGAAGEVAEGEATPTVQKATPNGREAFVLFVGDKEGGKSSLVTQFLNPNKLERPKPTVALEYTFGRRSNPANSQKDIAHIWELAGGMSASQLIRVPLTPDRLATAVVCITVNLEKPGNVIATTLKWINLITQQVNSCLEDVRKKNPALAATIQENAKKRNKNGDAELLCPVPLLIFASKYDVFAHEDGVKRKALMCALRHVAHVHGASLLCTSTGDKSVMNQFRNLLNHYVFCTDLKVKVGTEPGAPLVIPSGADTTESIGFPKSARSQADFDSQPVTSQLKKWEDSVGEFFRPVEDELQSSTSKDSSSSFVEPAVDALRAQKDEELRQYRKQIERKQKLAEASKAGATSDKADAKPSRRKSSSSSKGSK